MNNKNTMTFVCLILCFMMFLVACDKKEEQKATRNDEKIDATTNTQTIEEMLPETEYAKENEDGIKTNISDKIKEAKFNIDGLEINNIKINEAASRTEITADITNNTSEIKGDINIKITLLNSKGNTIIEMGGYIGTVEAGKTTKLNASATLDYASAYDIKIEKN